MLKAGQVRDGFGLGVKAAELSEVEGGERGLVAGLFANQCLELGVGDEDGLDRVLGVAVNESPCLLESDDCCDFVGAGREIDEVPVEIGPGEGVEAGEGFDGFDGVARDGERLEVGDGGEGGQTGEVVLRQGDVLESWVGGEGSGVTDAISVKREIAEVW